MSAIEKAKLTKLHFTRGYFCAVAKMIQLDGQVETPTRELFLAGGNPAAADPEDRDVFRQHGLLKGEVE